VILQEVDFGAEQRDDEWIWLNGNDPFCAGFACSLWFEDSFLALLRHRLH
jgi:hypothetical protein